MKYAQFICGPNAVAGHLCQCSKSRDECGCIARLTQEHEVRCHGCYQIMTPIDFESGEPASIEQTSALLEELM